MKLSAPSPTYAPDPLTQIRIESEIARLSALLESTTDELAGRMEDAAAREVAWKVAEAGALLKSEQKSAELRKADALIHCRKEYGEHLSADALRDALSEKCRTVRAQLDALRSLNANVRVQV